MHKTVNTNMTRRTGRGLAWRGALCAALLGVSLVAGAAAREIIPENVGTAHRDLYDLEWTDSGYGVAVGMLGTILTTKDGGDTWKFHDYGTRRALFSVAVSDDRMVITGQDGLVLVRDGRNGEWQKKDLGTKKRLFSVDMNDAGFGVITGVYGTLFRTTDGGHSWQKVKINLRKTNEGGYEPHLNRVEVLKNGVAVVVGEFGLVLRTKDRGKTWKVVRKGVAQLFGVDIRPGGLGYAVGQQGTVIRTRDGGKTWEKVETGTDGNLLGVAVGPNGTITAPGMRITIVSDNAGKTWTQLDQGDLNSLWYIDAVVTDHGVLAAGHTAKVIRLLQPGQGGADS